MTINFVRSTRLALRRSLFERLAAGVIALLPLTTAAQEPALTPVVIASPGPGSTVSLPLELAIKIGADRAEGLTVRTRFMAGGGAALKELQGGNSDFGIFGMPAAMLQHTIDPRIVTIAAIDDLPLYVLLVRKDLKGKVKSVKDLAGKVIGVHTNSLSAKTTSHQLIDLLLRTSGISPDKVRLTAAGANWESVSSTLKSGGADATMIDEPFASRLIEEGIGFVLFRTDNPDDIRQLPGATFLRVSLNVRRDRAEANPQLTEKVVRMLQHTLQWIASHKPEEIVDALAIADPVQRSALVATLRKNTRQYSRDARFSNAQLADTQIFFRASNADNAAAQKLDINDVVMDRWVGRKN